MVKSLKFLMAIMIAFTIIACNSNKTDESTPVKKELVVFIRDLDLYLEEDFKRLLEAKGYDVTIYEGANYGVMFGGLENEVADVCFFATAKGLQGYLDENSDSTLINAGSICKVQQSSINELIVVCQNEHNNDAVKDVVEVLKDEKIINLIKTKYTVIE